MDDAGDRRGWKAYYARTAQLPALSETAEFLAYIPSQGRVLDFGAGSGRWALAFMRDRPDLTIDLLDQNIDHAPVPDGWRGDCIKADFVTATLTQAYDGIWSYASLFFVLPPQFLPCLQTLIAALKPGGVLEFTMVEDCENAQLSRFHGMQQADLARILTENGLTQIAIRRDAQVRYGGRQLPIPTYFVRATKESQS
ncbi:MAG: class I SAM-dependent methyltransferase [Pseudomonadota bacterium]